MRRDFFAVILLLASSFVVVRGVSASSCDVLQDPRQDVSSQHATSTLVVPDVSRVDIVSGGVSAETTQWVATLDVAAAFKVYEEERANVVFAFDADGQSENNYWDATDTRGGMDVYYTLLSHNSTSTPWTFERFVYEPLSATWDAANTSSTAQIVKDHVRFTIPFSEVPRQANLRWRSAFAIFKSGAWMIRDELPPYSATSSDCGHVALGPTPSNERVPSTASTSSSQVSSNPSSNAIALGLVVLIAVVGVFGLVKGWGSE